MQLIILTLVAFLLVEILSFNPKVFQRPLPEQRISMKLPGLDSSTLWRMNIKLEKAGSKINEATVFSS